MVNQEEWLTVLTFSIRRSSSTHVQRGEIVTIDTSISVFGVSCEGGNVVQVPVEEKDILHPLKEIVIMKDGVAKVECSVEEATGRALGIHLCVETKRMSKSLSGGGFPSEEHVINLVRAVWKDARVDSREEVRSREHVKETPSCCQAWKEGLHLFPHQVSTVAWMKRVEEALPFTLSYPSNVRMGEGWYVDVGKECFTTDPGTKEVVATGGICADEPGSGKTAVALRLIAETLQCNKPDTPLAFNHLPAFGRESRYQTNCSLLILPLNLISQWSKEIDKFFLPGKLRTLFLTQGRDLKDVTMASLLEMDVVVTTFYFLRGCRAYLDMLGTALEGRPRTRATLSSWSRQEGRTNPVLEAVKWRRIVVDEMHDTFDNPRDTRILRLFDAHSMWGLTGTPVLDTEQAQHLYAFLSREEAHHPNLLSELIHSSVRCHTKGEAYGLRAHTESVKLVQMSEEEELRVGEETTRGALGVAEVVRRSTFIDSARDGSQEIEVQFKKALKRERDAIQARVEGYSQSLRMLENAGRDLLFEMEKAEQGSNEEEVRARLYVARQAHDSNLKHAHNTRALMKEEKKKLDAMEESEERTLQRLNEMRRRCSVCQSCRCDVVFTICEHGACDSCLQTMEGGSCPECGCSTGSRKRIGGIGTKMREIGEAISTCAPSPVILFVQWKSMVRGTKAFLTGRGTKVLLLDGNSNQRASTLSEFEKGGVLLLCLEEYFAGLHLAHAKVIIFAHAIVADAATALRLEKQAIARCVRVGQEGDVKVFSFVIKDSVEEEVWRETHSDGISSSSS